MLLLSKPNICFFLPVTYTALGQLNNSSLLKHPIPKCRNPASD